MIIKASERSGAKQLALHLSNLEDNDHVELHKVYGCIAQDIEGALAEMYAISRATRCKKHMFSISLSPPKGETPTISDFENAVDTIAKRLGLEDQPHILVFHEKAGRKHAHVVFSRIDQNTMKAINLSFYKDRLNEIAHELFLAHGWDVPKGFEDRSLSSPLNYGLTESHEGKKAGRDVQKIKAALQQCWQASDNRKAFEAALQSHGFYLCQGTRRGFVLLDTSGNIYSLSRWLGEKPKTLKTRLGLPENLPTIQQVKARIEITVDAAQKKHVADIPSKYAAKTAPLDQQKRRIIQRQREERQALAEKYSTLRDQAFATHSKEKRTGLIGLWHRFTGDGKRNADTLKDRLDTLNQQQQQESFELTSRHLQEANLLQIKYDRLKSWAEKQYNLSATQLINEQVRRDPQHVLSLLTDRQSIFTRNDIVRKLHDHIEEPEEFRNALSKVFASQVLVELRDPNSSQSDRPYYSTREMVDIEAGMIHNAKQMAKSHNHAVRPYLVRLSINKQDEKLQKTASITLSDEQRRAVTHITGKEQISAVVGLAGAGKSTMLAAAREAWERQGIRVFGAALAGKAAEGLQSSSGIPSRTLASYELSWKNGINSLQKGDVLVIDEAGMVGSKQLARFINEVQNSGAKLVLVGDPEQLQPINAGAPFRVIADKIGYAELTTIHRQKQEWQRQASYDFARGNMDNGLQAYDAHGAIQFVESDEEAQKALVKDYMADWNQNGDAVSRIALTHRRIDVKNLNKLIREAKQQRGELENEIIYETEHGKRAFAAGERILFTRNDRSLGVKNGTLGIVQQTEEEQITVQLDHSDTFSTPRTITVPLSNYKDIDHGYATTIHKSQGATVDHAYVLSSRTMDRNLTYVAMSRHRRKVNLYAGREETQNLSALSSQFRRAGTKRSTLDFEKNAYQTIESSLHHDTQNLEF